MSNLCVNVLEAVQAEELRAFAFSFFAIFAAGYRSFCLYALDFGPSYDMLDLADVFIANSIPQSVASDAS